jgi:hypothetical protein
MRKFGIFDGLLLQIVPPLTALLVKTLMATCRVVKVKGEKGDREALTRSGGAAVYTTWHQRMPYFSHYFRGRKITILISGSRDGEYAARIAARLGFNNVRGSSTRGGTKALRELIRTIKNGGKGGFFADGPQGPARIAKTGAVLAARDAQVPLIPVNIKDLETYRQLIEDRLNDCARWCDTQFGEERPWRKDEKE